MASSLILSISPRPLSFPCPVSEATNATPANTDLQSVNDIDNFDPLPLTSEGRLFSCGLGRTPYEGEAMKKSIDWLYSHKPMQIDNNSFNYDAEDKVINSIE